MLQVLCIYTSVFSWAESADGAYLTGPVYHVFRFSYSLANSQYLYEPHDLYYGIEFLYTWIHTDMH